MDDPISALDANVRKAIFKQVFQKLLKDKTRILVTHAVDFIHLADRIVIMKNGRITAQGTYNELSTNEYMNQIIGIHKKHKEENQAVANKGGSDQGSVKHVQEIAQDDQSAHEGKQSVKSPVNILEELEDMDEEELD